MDKIREARLNLKRAKFAFYLSVFALEPDVKQPLICTLGATTAGEL